jgi:serine protease Do
MKIKPHYLIAVSSFLLATNVYTVFGQTPTKPVKPTPAKATAGDTDKPSPATTTKLPNNLLVLNVADIIDQVNKAIVNIQSPSEEGQPAVGTGFIVDEKGLLITNLHVIRDALKLPGDLGRINVTVDSRNYAASVKGYDESTDLALLEIKSDAKFPVLTLGDSDKVRVGEWAIAVGSPFGLEHSVTLGIISGKSRTSLDGEYDDYLQTDAAINFGNSGGPLLNTKGEVIGINTLVLAKGQGLGFAIPVNMLREILPQLRDQGRVRRSSLNIDTTDIPTALAERLALPPGTKGVVVAKVERDTTAAKAGLRREDVIISVNDTPISSTGHFNRLISRLAPGTKVAIKIRREEREFTLNAEVVEKK